MATVKRLGPGSAFKTGLVLYAAVGLLVGIVWALFSLVAGSVGSMASAGAPGVVRFFGLGFGVWAVIIFPICYGILGRRHCGHISGPLQLGRWVGRRLGG